MARLSVALLLLGCLCAAVTHGAAAAQARALLQITEVPAVGPDGNPMSASPFEDPNLQKDIAAGTANIAKVYNLKTTTPNPKSAVVVDVQALMKLNSATPAAIAAATDKAAKALIAAAQANNLADAGYAIETVAATELWDYVQPLCRAVNKLVVAQPAKTGGIFALASMYTGASGNALSQVGYELMFTWEYAGNDQTTLNALAQASADAAIAGGKQAARTWGEALGYSLTSEMNTIPAAQEDAYARAAAAVMCKGGANTGAWASVYSVALNKLARNTAPGCSVLSKAMGLVKAQKCTLGTSKGLNTLLSFCKIKAK